MRPISGANARLSSTLTAPEPDESPKQYSENIQNIVTEISKLTLLEVAELNELLKVYCLYYNLNNIIFQNYPDDMKIFKID